MSVAESRTAGSDRVIVVGAGLAGLVCARHLLRQRVNVLVLESADDVGGRVRSDHVDGFILDRGFQVLFDAYPAARRNLDLEALDLRPFDPGAIICYDGARTVLTDPWRDRTWRDVFEAARTGAIPPDDKLRLARLAAKLRDTDADQDAEPDVRSTIAYLRQEGFSDDTIDRFFRPFYGGIFLNRALSTSEAAFRFYQRMLNVGRATLPARGMGAIAQQLAMPLRDAAVLRADAPVESLIRENQRVRGVRLANGEELRADAVVLATDAATAQSLAQFDLAAPAEWLAVNAVYFAGAQAPYTGPKIALNAAPDALVNNAQVVSNVAPSYAPAGKHLLSAAILGTPDMDDAQLAAAALDDLRRMFAGNERALAALDTFEPLRVYRIPQAQFAQPPGIYSRLPGNTTHVQGLFVTGEWTEASSINGAMTSGERCAAAVGKFMRERAA